MTIWKVGRSAFASTLANAYYGPATIVLLYSRLTGLTNAFPFHHARSSSNLAPYASDPYLLPLHNGEQDFQASKTNPLGPRRRSRVSAINLKAMKYESPQGSALSGRGHIYLENDVVFYQLSLLTNDLALSECLYAEVAKEFKAGLCPPNTISRLETVKTPANVRDDFVVHNGYVDRDDEESRTAEKESDVESGASLALLDKDPCTISFEWLDNEIHGTLTDASSATAFHDHLDLLHNEMEDRVASGLPTMETLYVNCHD